MFKLLHEYVRNPHSSERLALALLSAMTDVNLSLWSHVRAVAVDCLGKDPLFNAMPYGFADARSERLRILNTVTTDIVYANRISVSPCLFVWIYDDDFRMALHVHDAVRYMFCYENGIYSLRDVVNACIAREAGTRTDSAVWNGTGHGIYVTINSAVNIIKVRAGKE